MLKDGNKGDDEMSAGRAFQAEHTDGTKECKKALVLANGLINW